MTDAPREIVRDGTAAYEREWVADHADRRRDRWDKRKRQLDTDRRIKRAGMTALQLHHLAVEREAKISTVSAPPVGRSSPSSEHERVGPPRQQTLDDDPRWREIWFVVRRRLEDAHRLLDEAEGHGPTAASTMMKEEKDRLILSEGRGLSCDAVVDLLGREVAGSSRTVWRVRREAGMSTVDGEPLPERDDPRVRRVVIDER